MKRKSNALIHLMQARGLTLALAESMTAGLACHRLAGVKGACDVLKGSVVCYNAAVKTHLLDVSKTLIDRCTPESKEVTGQLALKLSRKMKADVYAAVTGLAAPGGSETKTKPVGTVFLAVRYKNKMHHLRCRFKGSPIEIRRKATDKLYGFIMAVIQ